MYVSQAQSIYHSSAGGENTGTGRGILGLKSVCEPFLHYSDKITDKSNLNKRRLILAHN